MSEVIPIDKEYKFTGRVIISETDTKGVIVYANRKFCEIACYTKDELIGQPHNIIRHPDMPKKAFEDLWRTIKNGSTWNGVVKNLRKDGLYYWVDTTITPNINDEEEIVGYSAVRRVVKPLELKKAISLYNTMLENEL